MLVLISLLEASDNFCAEDAVLPLEECASADLVVSREDFITTPFVIKYFNKSILPVPAEIDPQEVIEARVVGLEVLDQPFAQRGIHAGVRGVVILFVVLFSQLRFF